MSTYGCQSQPRKPVQQREGTNAARNGDIEGLYADLLARGATGYEPLTQREEDFVTAAVIDPFGNVLGIMRSPHWQEAR